jgi:hypothetical protein
MYYLLSFIGKSQQTELGLEEDKERDVRKELGKKRAAMAARKQNRQKNKANIQEETIKSKPIEIFPQEEGTHNESTIDPTVFEKPFTMENLPEITPSNVEIRVAYNKHQ